MINLKPSDLLAATAPTLSATIISPISEIAGLCGTLFGMGYLAWKWRTEYLANKKREDES